MPRSYRWTDLMIQTVTLHLLCHRSMALGAGICLQVPLGFQQLKHMDWNGRPLPWRCSDIDKFAEAIFDLNRCVTISCVSSLPLTSTFSIPVVRSFCLLVSFRLTLRLGLRSVLPRLRGNPVAVSSGLGVALSTIVPLSAALAATVCARGLLARWFLCWTCLESDFLLEGP